MDFDTALQAFCDQINKETQGYVQVAYKDSPHMQWGEYFKPIAVMDGRKNVRLVSSHGSGGSAYCFVNKENGDILMAAGWKAPAKGKRGNIYDPSTYVGKGLYRTAWLYR